MTIDEFLKGVKASPIWKELPIRDRVNWAWKFTQSYDSPEAAISLVEGKYKQKLIDAFGKDAVDDIITQLVIRRLRK